MWVSNQVVGPVREHLRLGLMCRLGEVWMCGVVAVGVGQGEFEVDIGHECLLRRTETHQVPTTKLGRECSSERMKRGRVALNALSHCHDDRRLR